MGNDHLRAARAVGRWCFVLIEGLMADIVVFSILKDRINQSLMLNPSCSVPLCYGKAIYGHPDLMGIIHL